CCDDDSSNNMRCSWKIERVELPQAKPPELAPAGSASSPGPAGGPLGMLGQLALNPGNVPTDGGLAGLASTFKEGTGGTQGIEAMAMSVVYPTLKPMLEASIRKVTVTVQWKEGLRDRDLTIAQYLTRPMKGLPMPSAAGSGTPSPFGGGLPL